MSTTIHYDNFNLVQTDFPYGDAKLRWYKGPFYFHNVQGWIRRMQLIVAVPLYTGTHPMSIEPFVENSMKEGFVFSPGHLSIDYELLQNLTENELDKVLLDHRKWSNHKETNDKIIGAIAEYFQGETAKP